GAQHPGGFYQYGGTDGGVEFEFGGTGFSDFFEAFFGGGRGRSRVGALRGVRRTSGDSRTRERCRSGHHGHARRSAPRIDEIGFATPRGFKQSGNLPSQNPARRA